MGHGLLLTAPHTVIDGWSRGIVVEELCAAYAAARDGGAEPPPPPPLQYADYAVWQRRPSAEEGEHLAYWKRQLAGVSPLDLPADRPRPATRTSAGAMHRVTVPEPGTARIPELAAPPG